MDLFVFAYQRREMNHLETMFARQASTGENNTFNVRCFTPEVEIGFCGHGLFGVALALKRTCPNGMILKTSDGLHAMAEFLPGDVATHVARLGVPDEIRLLIPSAAPDQNLLSNKALRTNIAKAIGISPEQILNLTTNSLKDIVIEVDTNVDFSAESQVGVRIDTIGLWKASPPNTRAQIITSRGQSFGVDYVKRVFWEGVEGLSTIFHAVLY